MADAERMTADAILALLSAEGDPLTLAGLVRSWGVDADRAVGIPRNGLKRIARSFEPDHAVAHELWKSGLYEARMIAALTDEPAKVTPEQMQSWIEDAGPQALVATACDLFARAPRPWPMVTRWASDDRHSLKLAGFTLLQTLALQEDAPRKELLNGLRLIEANVDVRIVSFASTLIHTARTIALERPTLHADAAELARRLGARGTPQASFVGHGIERFATPRDA